MKRFLLIFILTTCVCYIAIYMAFLSVPLSSVFSQQKVPEPNVYAKKEQDLLGFIEKHLIGNDGGIATNINKQSPDTDTLSESVGLLMSYCVIRDRKDLFEKEYNFLKDSLFAEDRYIKWRVGKKDVSCNAAIDDLRIARALLDAHNKWGVKKYADTAGFIQEGIYNRQVSGGKLREFYDWKRDVARKNIPLCYLDIYTMDRLSIFNEGWGEAVDNSLKLIQNGRLDKGSPFFYKHFSYGPNQYFLDEEFNKTKGLCITYTLYTVLHMAEYNENTDFFTGWLKQEIDKGKLYAWYNPQTLKPSQNTESTAVYALAAVYARKVGEKSLSNKLVDRMLRFMVTDESSPYYGGFGDVKNSDFYSFDNLTALWALGIAGGQ
ncbi:MAG: glycosyl hydrolase family 8 [Clostridia bacterium]|nr:glycosyl hydrolase family 8 [Clostridia bacterium]